MNTTLKKAFSRIIFLLFYLYGYVAHAAPPCPGGEDPPCSPHPDDASIDGNITILLVITALFGIYIIYNNKLNKKRPV